MPALAPKQLMLEGAPTIPADAAAASAHALQAGGANEVKENLSKFVDSLHQKASCLTTWLATLEQVDKPGPRAQKHFGYIGIGFLKNCSNIFFLDEESWWDHFIAVTAGLFRNAKLCWMGWRRASWSLRSASMSWSIVAKVMRCLFDIF